MPLYEYECDACGGRFEVIQKFSETTDQCRKCGKGPVRRLQSAPGFQFKGTGWYVTDYAQKGKSGGESKSDGESSAGKSSDGDKTDTKKSDSGSPSDSATKSDSTTSSSTPAAAAKD